MKFKIFQVLLIILLFNLCNVLKAQPYIPLLTSNQKWEQFQGNASICNWYAGQIVSLDSDTLFLGNTYKKVFENPIYSTNSQGQFCAPYYVNASLSNCVGYVREDTTLMKVFLGDPVNGMEYVIYDFLASDGDTLQNYYGLPDLVIVDSVRVLNYPVIGDRNTYYVSCNGSQSDFYFYIEGIGGNSGFLKPLYPLASGSQELTCVRDTLYNSIYGNCYSGFVGINELSDKNLIFEYSAFENSFQLKSDLGTDTYKVEFYDLSGRVIQQYSGLKTNSEYPLNEKMEGMVLYSVFVLDSKVILSGRVLAGN